MDPNPITSAAQTSVLLCKSKNIEEWCQDCPCADSVRIALEAGYQIEPDALFERKIPLRVAYTILRHISHWRERLKKIARPILVGSEGTRFDLEGTSVLDAEAEMVIESLAGRGTSVGKALSLAPDDYRLVPFAG